MIKSNVIERSCSNMVFQGWDMPKFDSISTVLISTTIAVQYKTPSTPNTTGTINISFILRDTTKLTTTPLNTSWDTPMKPFSWRETLKIPGISNASKPQ